MIEPEGSPQSRRVRVLCVDDDAVILAWEAAVLRQGGFEVAKASSGSEGLTELERFQPDVVLLDIMMPDLDGWVVHELIRKRSDVPVVLVSVVAAAGESVLRGASAFVRKPPRPHELLDAVRRTIGRSEGETAILVVEDDHPLRELYRSLLEMKTGHRVVEAEDGLDALEVLASEPCVRLVVTDVHMPRMNGVELVRRMRADDRWKGLPVIVQTSDALVARSNVWVELGVEQALEKDDFRNWLRAAVQKAVPQRAARA